MREKKQNAQISLLLIIWRKVKVKKDDNNERIDEGKSEGETTDSVSTTVNNEEFGGDVDLDDFYDFYDNEDKNITKFSIVWVNTNKTIWEGRVIKTPFSEMSEDAKHLKLIWINTKKEERVLIKKIPKNINKK